jgi:hypothetical protein
VVPKAQDLQVFGVMGFDAVANLCLTVPVLLVTMQGKDMDNKRQRHGPAACTCGAIGRHQPISHHITKTKQKSIIKSSIEPITELV